MLLNERRTANLVAAKTGTQLLQLNVGMLAMLVRAYSLAGWLHQTAKRCRVRRYVAGCWRAGDHVLDDRVGN